MRHPVNSSPPIHLIAVCICVGICITATCIGVLYAKALERKYVNVVGQYRPTIMLEGVAFQKSAFATPNLLPIYGASEVLGAPGDFQAEQFFKQYPTGFTVFPVAGGGNHFITEAEELAALGGSLQGKKVVISFTPSQFFRTADTVTPQTYAGFFSPLQAYALALNSDLSFHTRQDAAKRMLQYPETLSNDPLLRLTLRELAINSPSSRLLYYMLWPLAKTRLSILELQDHYQSVAYLRTQKLDPAVTPKSEAIDWDAALLKARSETRSQSTNNPFGFTNSYWEENAKNLQLQLHNKKYAAQISSAIDNSSEWSDLELLLQILLELGARPMLVGRPIHTLYYTSVGVPFAKLQDFYARLNGIAARYGVPLADFHEYQDDTRFGADALGHASPEGWLHIDHVLDTFYHETDY